MAAINMAERHQYVEEFLRTGSEALAVDALVGSVAIVVVFIGIWATISRGYIDAKTFWTVFIPLSFGVLAIWPNLPFEAGMLFRAMFMGSLPALGWMSFFAIVVFGGFALGYHHRGNQKKAEAAALKQEAAPQPLRAPEAPRSTITQARPVPLPKAAPEVPRLQRLNTPPAVPVAHRREEVLRIGKRK